MQEDINIVNGIKKQYCDFKYLVVLYFIFKYNVFDI